MSVVVVDTELAVPAVCVVSAVTHTGLIVTDAEGKVTVTITLTLHTTYTQNHPKLTNNT